MKSLLIRAEDKNIWEKRAAIVPADLKLILEETGTNAYIEKSEKRFFTEDAYGAAGANLCEGMEKGDVIFGVKEIPEEKILDDKTYIFFSHTIKGQPSGMPLLKKIMDSNATLIDYEKITDDKNRRLIYFGRYAGDAGAIDILHLMGEYWDHHGIDTPFKACKAAHQYASVADAKVHITKIGETIKEQGLPEKLSPMIIGVLGYGNVSGGAQQILDCLPTRRIAPCDLNDFVKKGEFDPKIVYVSVFKEEDLVVNKEGRAFELQEYYDHPERFESQFEQYMPSISLLVNAVYWDKQYPRFVTWENLKRLYENQENPRLCGIADITCDTHGSMECNVKSTDSGMPAYLVDPMTRAVTDGHKGDGIVVLAVDNLPCEIPNDSSTFFSNQLKPFVANILKADYASSLDESGLCPEIKKAVIVYNGQLTPGYQYLRKFL
ncbi:alpha-aminoadipic semialdehyde synthase [Desulfocicer vacuolatum DSM 3385]|uniref:Alpha-aminoadipic semialdehyde synthase n=1 Tax=Desulfocicer vacuolatum DSM 3385 TaxID=1121400 RepID=A0A1W2DLV1_9BACT|nr:bifunctional lysine ketoglutarate reductase /saccharopine dehydrogenase family protein [Desulfocicer vacuolatum]SMC97976.1 alpha-aminoadipic semialdehyde synthase [Desulfocicer vacuolatum DSM 3385]